ncbi:unnamed protein product [Gongylonema pulchrum]|uniref:Uncharacterized protein n=1 Tax=Gongylonema pulchrum TaxID=637853 RepID=A0A183E7C8_9BILA|nr:unnamed protein product [Gongylonema pulchrum]VDN33379.1 unnamed protein product [Gongylonema pulchrum]
MPVGAVDAYQIIFPSKRTPLPNDNFGGSASGRIRDIDDADEHPLIVRRTQLTQLNRLLKKPVFNFANLFRRY